MRKDILKYDEVVTDKVNENAKIDDIIEKYGNNPKEYIDDILELMRNKKISIGDIPKVKQTKELLIKYLDMPEIDYNVQIKWISKRVLDEDVWKKLVPLCSVADYDKIPSQYLTEECYLKIAKSFIVEYEIHLIPADSITEEILLEALASSFECLSNTKLDKKIFEKFDINALKEKALVIRKKREQERAEEEELSVKKYGWYEIHKWYSSTSGHFNIRGYRTRNSEFQLISFNTFDEFYNFILETLPEERRNSASPRPLDKMDLMEYDFNDIDISKYDLTPGFSD